VATTSRATAGSSRVAGPSVSDIKGKKRRTREEDVSDSECGSMAGSGEHSASEDEQVAPARKKPKLSEYEAERNANIARNKALLVSLGLAGALPPDPSSSRADPAFPLDPSSPRADPSSSRADPALPPDPSSPRAEQSKEQHNSLDDEGAARDAAAREEVAPRDDAADTGEVAPRNDAAETGERIVAPEEAVVQDKATARKNAVGGGEDVPPQEPAARKGDAAAGVDATALEVGAQDAAARKDAVAREGAAAMEEAAARESAAGVAVEGAPLWVNDALTFFKERSFGAEWASLIMQWVEFEKSVDFGAGDIGRGVSVLQCLAFVE
jgi:hypothetical protein